MGKRSNTGHKSGSAVAARNTATAVAPEPEIATAGGVLHRKFDKSERDSIDAYSGWTYNDINRTLRGQFPGGLKDKEIMGHIKNIDSALNKGRLARDQILYRGISMSAFGGQTPKKGGILSDKGFLSTSRSRGSAELFGGGQAILRIKARAGTRAIDVSHTVGGNEHETMFGRNQSLRIKSTKTDKRGRLIISVETL